MRNAVTAINGKRQYAAVCFSLGIVAVLLALAFARWPAPRVASSAIEPVIARPRSASASGDWVLVGDWPRIPDTMRVGAGSGVAIDRMGHVWLLHRAGRPFTNTVPIAEPTVLRLHPETGAVEQAWGERLFLSPHGLTIDDEGTLWITDVMANTVRRFSPEGRELLRLGRAHTRAQALCVDVRTVLHHLPCRLDDDQFARPTDVAVAHDGAIFVADGYRNSRIAHFDAQGRFVAAWGQIGNGDNDLFLPHGIAMDVHGRLFVADRRNARLQVRARDGRVLAQWRPAGIGRPFGVTVGRMGDLWVADGGDALDVPDAAPRGQAVQLSTNGHVKARWRWPAEALPNGLVMHDIAVGLDGSVYVATLDARAIYKLTARGSR